MMPYMIGQCFNCGNDAMVKNPNGKIMGPRGGTIPVFLRCQGPSDSSFADKITRIGPAPLCGDCSFDSVKAEDLKTSYITSPLNFLPADCNELKYLTDLSLELADHF